MKKILIVFALIATTFLSGATLKPTISPTFRSKANTAIDCGKAYQEAYAYLVSYLTEKIYEKF